MTDRGPDQPDPHPDAEPGAPNDAGWTVLSVPIDGPPPTDIQTEEEPDPDPPGDASWVTYPGGAAGPPGGRIFSLEGRPAPALYLIGWLGTVVGLVMLSVALLSEGGPIAALVAIGGVVVLTIGLSVAAGYQLVARASRPAQAYHGPSPLILFGIVLCVTTIVSTVLTLLVHLDPDAPAGFLIGLAAVALVYLGVVWLFVVRGGAMDWSQMGWPAWMADDHYRLKRFLGDIGTAVVLMVPTLFGAALLGGILITVLGDRPPSVLPVPADGPGWLLVAISGIVIAPIGEELFFRAFVITAWWRDLGPRRALIQSSVLFAFVHIANVMVEPGQGARGLVQAFIEFAIILPVGFALGWLFMKRGLVASIAGHMAYNGLAIGLVLLARSAT